MPSLGWDRAALEPALRVLAVSPDKVGILLDFDGTLAPIQEDPGTVVPAPGAVEVLARLSAAVGLVAVVSARPVAFLQRHFGGTPAVRLFGLYGLESTGAGGEPVTLPAAAAWREPIAQLTELARAELPPQVRIEPKGLSLSLHYRAHPEYEVDVWRWAEAQAARTGLRLQPGRLVAELRPPVGGDKGDTIRSLVEGLACAVYAGDDTSDVEAFAALAAYPQLIPLRIAVRNREVGPELMAAADIAVDGPAELVALLAALAPAGSPVRPGSAGSPVGPG
jgi:trehalose 6-phosphate phosphatase